MAKEKIKRLESRRHERESPAASFGRRWPEAERPAPQRPLERELIKEVSCALGYGHRRQEDKNIRLVGVHDPRLHRREAKRGGSHFGDNCCWLIEESLLGRFGRGKQEEVTDRLEEAAEKGDARAFIQAVRGIDWKHTNAERFVSAIRLALRAGTPAAAQYIYDEGVKLHPDDPGLQTFSRLFAPRRQVVKTFPANPTLSANREWLKVHRAKYRGQWVAISNGELIAAAASLDELRSRVGNTPNVLLTKA